MQTGDKTLCIVDHDPIMGETLRNRLGLDGFAADWHETTARIW